MMVVPPERWARLKEAFARAVEDGAAAGEAACAGDPELRSELESLLLEFRRASDAGPLSEWALPASGARVVAHDLGDEETIFTAGDRVAGYTIELFYP